MCYYLRQRNVIVRFIKPQENYNLMRSYHISIV